MSFINEIKALVGIKAQEEDMPAPAPEPAPEDNQAEESDAMEAMAQEVAALTEKVTSLEERIAALEAAMTTTTEEASAAAKAALEAKEGVTFIAKATSTKFVPPVAGMAQEPVQVSKRVGSKSLTTK
jgi:septal ring factor EnvC (AmiA/AmiB activator)